ncbi:hypothetical protein TGRUB_434410 [Toxoplasma gondii RUB]|uniref:Cytochrome b/b6 N-terminal region profile domain-containing protein n=2 Tax=Toxoplasma gondii TaxID=5811 RepID=A0A086LIV1_TOXGO|nr:hypothetical protein TGRUB_434410 [Toxoplasma gondii RUB]
MMAYHRGDRVRALLGRTSDGSADERICTDICSRRHQLHSQVLFGVHLRRVYRFLTMYLAGLYHQTVEAKCVTYLVREVAAGWEFKTLHAPAASFVFVCIFVHATRILSRFHTQRLIS